jgi:PAS domain S-box-containing protein
LISQEAVAQDRLANAADSRAAATFAPSIAIAVSQPDFRILFESAPGLYLVLLPDAPRYTIVAVSDAYARATMTRREEILGRGLFEAFPDNPDDPEATGVRNLSASLGRVLDTRGSDTMAVQKYDVRRPAEQGGGFEERWWSPMNSPAFDCDGKLVYLLHRVEDVTDFVRLRQQGLEHEKTAAELRTRTESMEAEIFHRAQELQQVNEQLRSANAEISRLYDKTRELDRLKTQFFANVSHELRTPLTLILGPVQRLLASKTALPELAQQDLMVVERNARTLLRHVDDLLDVARLEEQQMVPAYAQTDVPALARLVSSHFDSVAQDLGIRWQVELPEVLQAQLDPQMLQRVLFNLLSNAFKFTPTGAQVRLSLTPRGEGLVFEVADGGPGVPVEWRDAVFERFRQLQGNAHRPRAGTGLGLAIAREFVQLHGGTISISDAPEGGALFTVELPRRAPEGTAVTPETPGPAAAIAAASATIDSLRAGGPSELVVPAPGSQPLVLVVEDNTDMSAFICGSLRSEWRVAAAFDGAQGLAQALALHPDLVLTDIMMPGVSGETLLRELRRRREFDDVPVVVLSARADDALRVKLLREGAQDYLIKPFAVEELRARVSTLLARSQAMVALRRSEEYWRELFAQASDGILIGDAQCRSVVDVNEAACVLLGRSRDDVLHHNPCDWLASAAAEAQAQLATGLTADQPVTREWHLWRGDGSAVYVDVVAKRLSDGRCLALLRDATQRRQREQVAAAMAEELERRVARRTEQLRRLAAELEVAENRERRQIARDLHDDLGQVLAAARIRLSGLCQSTQEDVRRAALEISELVEQANRSTRSLAAQLAPAVLYELGLAPALEWLAEEILRRFGLHVEVHDDGRPKPLSQEARSIAYRAVRELLINVAKHAGVKHAAVSLLREDGCLVVHVSDGGVGFPVEGGKAASGQGVGLVSVHERLSYIGGSFGIRSVPGDGTEAMLRVPLDPEQIRCDLPVSR